MNKIFTKFRNSLYLVYIKLKITRNMLTFTQQTGNMVVPPSSHKLRERVSH